MNTASYLSLVIVDNPCCHHHRPIH